MYTRAIYIVLAPIPILVSGVGSTVMNFSTSTSCQNYGIVYCNLIDFVFWVVLSK